MEKIITDIFGIRRLCLIIREGALNNSWPWHHLPSHTSSSHDSSPDQAWKLMSLQAYQFPGLWSNVGSHCHFPHCATLLLCIVPCTALQYTALHCTAPHYTTLPYNAPLCTTLHCTTLQCIADILYRVLHCPALCTGH